jgi:hypothetical protein
MTRIARTEYLCRAEAPAITLEIRYVRLSTVNVPAINRVDVDGNTVVMTRTRTMFAAPIRKRKMCKCPLA